jgi:twinkle protein
MSDIWDQAVKRPEWGNPWPWPTLTSLTYGRRLGEIYGIASTAGAGKSEFAKEIVYQTIFVDKKKIACAFLEEAAPISAKRIAGKICNTPFHLPDVDYDVEDLEGALTKLNNNLWLYDHSGYKSWADIKQYFKYCSRSLGINEFILDNLTAITAQEENEYTALNKIMEELSSLSIELNASIYYMAHLRKATGTDHANGGQVHLVELKGSGAIANWSNFVFGIERNTQSPDPNERNTSILRVLKDRTTGISVGSTIQLWYDHSTGRYREKTDEDGVDLDY